MSEKKDAMQDLENRVMARDDEPAPEDDYGNIHHPKKPLLTALLYTLALAALLAAAVLFSKLFA